MTSFTHTIQWQDGEMTKQARWHSESGAAAPKRVVLADDTMTADSAYRLACEGTALLWKGDFQNARQLLQALARRCDRPPKKARPVKAVVEAGSAQLFNLHRQAQSQRARILAMVLVPLSADYTIPLRRAPDVALACNEAYGAASDSGDSVISLRELQGLIGAHEWRKKGVPIPALGDSIHPHYGVFSPVRGEYIDLVATAATTVLSENTALGTLAFDIGTGTGVLAAVLAQRGVQRVIGTDQDPRALACAKENLQRLGLAHAVDLLATDLFPSGRAPLIVCNPPWLPARPSSPIEHAIFDPESRMLRGFITGLSQHLVPKGEGWLLLSDLAEHLGLRSRAQLLEWIAAAGLTVLARSDIKPTHSKVSDDTDPLHAARAAEITSLWRLVAA